MTFETTVQPRYRDLDPMGHVNNAVYATYLEHARTAFFREAVGRDLADANVALASLSIEFRRSIDRLGEVTVELAVVDLGTTSATLSYDLRLDGETAATAESVQVALDDEGAPTPIPADVREAFERHPE
ncbi:acyl-CoA thioesterase [Halorarum salinum]|uniref:Acyl-CoA thioesterase n=1 Tax=Halorarum salinum TaxID=2743089 RepID=A0A7D5QD73_9EURY|nr:thioesterase family protein [Halobaculum salinum]QLG63619.1 acyl-CoA thioesterase [Halobaculum salinum]